MFSPTRFVFILWGGNLNSPSVESVSRSGGMNGISSAICVSRPAISSSSSSSFFCVSASPERNKKKKNTNEKVQRKERTQRRRVTATRPSLHRHESLTHLQLKGRTGGCMSTASRLFCIFMACWEVENVSCGRLPKLPFISSTIQMKEQFLFLMWIIPSGTNKVSEFVLSTCGAILNIQILTRAAAIHRSVKRHKTNLFSQSNNHFRHF